ncbi:MAG: hypothetical protein RMX97_08005 [Nostoc sp. DedQUE11]|nr:hypothetical protein [Nostoc sp. DedQUE11]
MVQFTIENERSPRRKMMQLMAIALLQNMGVKGRCLRRATPTHFKRDSY